MLHIGDLHYTDMLPRFHLGGYTGTAFTLNHQVQDALPPAGYTKRTQSARWLLPYMMRY